MNQNTSSNEQPHSVYSCESIETLWHVIEELEERVMHLEVVMLGIERSMTPDLKVQQHQVFQPTQQPEAALGIEDATSLKVRVERVCFPMLRRTPKPDKSQLDWIIDELVHHIPDMTRQEIIKEVCEFFRKNREYMKGRIDTALRNHFTTFEMECMEDVKMLLEFTVQNNDFIDHIRDKASIDIEDDEAARSFVQKRIHHFLLKLAQRFM